MTRGVTRGGLKKKEGRATNERRGASPRPGPSSRLEAFGSLR
jgi:hypothetical protein